MFRRLGVNFIAHAHPLHECSKYRKGVDQFDLYLASGLGTSPDKNPKETKCENLVESSSQQPFSLLCQPSGDIRVTDSESSCTFCSFVACVNANIDSCLLRLELNCMLSLLYLKVLLVVWHVTTEIMLVIIYLLEDEQELSLGMLIRPKRIYNFCLLHACLRDFDMFCVTLSCFA